MPSSANHYLLLLSLTRLGLGNDIHLSLTIPDNVDWEVLKALAEEQGLAAVVVDGIEKMPMNQRPPKTILLQWISDTLQVYEYRYELYRRTIAEMAAFYNSHGFKMMVLKGYACSLDWPTPEHRPCGDIDIWQFGQYKEADATLVKEKGVEIDNSHHHHTVFFWRDFMVENHYDFIEVHHHKSGPGLEKILKEQGANDLFSIDIYGEKVYLPSPNLHALFLLRHAMEHFASTGINLRQLLDWAFFVKAHGTEVDWGWLEGILEEYGMRRLYEIFNAICVENLGFDASLFTMVQYDPYLKEKVLNEILAPGFRGAPPKGFLSRVVFKFRRWKANGWKQKLCYNGSRWSAFLYAAWNHILKPSSI